MNRLRDEQRAGVGSALVDGNSVRAACRIVGVTKSRVLKRIEEVGQACLDYQRRVMVNLPCQRVQIDEFWAFVGAKEASVAKDRRGQGRKRCALLTVPAPSGQKSLGSSNGLQPQSFAGSTKNGRARRSK